MGTGSYKVGELAAQDSVLKDLDIGTHFLECTTAGTIAIPSRQSHGCWEFDLYKGADGNAYFLNFITNNKEAYSYPVGAFNGYVAYFSTGEAVQILKSIEGGTPSAVFSTATSYVDNSTWYRLKVARLKSEGVFKDIPTLQVSDIVSLGAAPYTTFTSNGRYGFSAMSNGSGTNVAGTVDEIVIVDTVKYLVEFDLTLNSGTAPDVRLSSSLGTGLISNSLTTTNGRNSIILTATASTTGVIRFQNASTATDFKVSGLTIRRIYPANDFAVFIKGGSFGDIYTLVDTTGGSGSNPVGDSTYTTSEFLVADLDAGDKITNLLLTDQVKQ